METVHASIDLPRGVFSALCQDPSTFVREMHIAAAVKWYELQLLSQDQAAEVAGLSRSAFLDALARFEVSPFQYSADEITEECSDA